MTGEKDLDKLLKTMKPKHNFGDYVFSVVDNLENIDLKDIVLIFKEPEGNTIIIEKDLADSLNLKYSFIAAWITLTVHSSLEAVGLTAAFSSALARARISCNVVAGYYQDHIFVEKKDITKAMEILNKLSD